MTPAAFTLALVGELFGTFVALAWIVSKYRQPPSGGAR